MSTLNQTINPFPGLRPFRPEEDYLFFGREQQTMELLKRLGDERFVAVVGTSGSGKSSLVRCGLMSELLGGKLLRAGVSWEVAVTHPGGNPLGLLVESLIEADLYDSGADDVKEQLLATLNRSRFGLVEAVRQSELGQDTNLLLVVDQFEEVFRFNEAGQVQQEMATEFVNMLLEAASQSEIPIYIVLTMRSDFIGDCAQFEGLAEAVNRGEFLIPRLTRDEFKRVIESPAKVAGGGIAPRLLQKLLNDLGQQADQLPCLQHALMRTWELWQQSGEARAVDLQDYERAGRMAQALSIHADEIYHALTNEQEEICAGMFKALTVQEADNRGVRRPQRMARLCQILGVDPSQLRPIIEAFRAPGVTFLMPSSEVELTERTIVDISHESLMRVWQRLRNWVEDENQSARVYRRLAETAVLHEKGNAGLYRDPDLQIARSWRDANQPTQAWGTHYHPQFELAMSFLDESHEAVAATERAKQEAARRELQQAKELAETQSRAARNVRRFSAGVTVLALAAIGLAMWALKLRAGAEIHRKEAVVLAEKAEQEAERAQEAEAHANHLARKANHETGTVWLERAQGQLKEKRHLDAKLLAARSIGFEGVGGEVQSDANNTSFRSLLENGTPEYEAAVRLIEEQPSYTLIRETAASPHLGNVSALAYSRDGQRLATGNRDGEVQIWDLATRKQLHRVVIGDDTIKLVGFTNDDSAVLAAESSGLIRCIEIGSGVTRWEVDEDDVDVACLSHDREVVAIGDDHEVIKRYRTSDGKALRGFRAESDLEGLKYSDDGKVILAASGLGILMVIDAKTGETIDRTKTDGSQIREISASPDGTWIAARVGPKTVKTWRRDAGKLKAVGLYEYDDFVTSLFVSPVGPTLFVGQSSATIVSRNIESGEPDSTWQMDTGTPTSVMVQHPHHNLLLTATFRGGIALWDLETKANTVRRDDGFQSTIVGVNFSADGRLFLAAAADGTVELTDLSNNKRVWRSSVGSAFPNVTAFIPHKSQLIVKYGNGFGFLNAKTGQEEDRIDQAGTIGAVNRDKSLLAIAHREEEVVSLWSTDTLQKIDTLTVKSTRIWGMSFSADSQRLAIGDGEGNVVVFDVKDRKQVQSWTVDSSVWALAFHPIKQSVLATAGSDDTVTLWDTSVSPPKMATAMKGHKDSVRWIDFTPNGAMLASGCDLGEIRLWDTASGDLVTVIDAHQDQIQMLKFAPDGRTLASSSADRTVRFWSMPSKSHFELRDGSDAQYGAAFVGSDAILVGGDGDVKLLDRQSGRTQRTIKLTDGATSVPSISASRSGMFAAAGRYDISLIDVQEWKIITTFKGGSHRYNPGHSFSHDDRYFAVPSGEWIHIWDLKAKKWQRHRQPHPVWTVDFSADGRLFAGDYNGNISIISSTTWQTLESRVASKKPITRLAVSDDGKRLATGGHDGILRVWDAESLKLISKATVVESGAWLDVAFTTKGQVVTADTNDRCVRIWDAVTGRKIREFAEVSESTFDVDVDPENNWIVAGGHGAVTHVYSLQRTKPIRTLFEQLEGLRFDGAALVRVAPEFFGRPGLALVRPVNSHLRWLGQADSGSALFEHYLPLNLDAAAAVLPQIAADQREAAQARWAEALLVHVDKLLISKQYELALAYLQMKTSSASSNTEFRQRLFKVLVALGRTDEATEALGKPGDIDTETALLLLKERLAASLQNGKIDEATADFERIVELAPKDSHEQLRADLLNAMIELAEGDDKVPLQMAASILKTCEAFRVPGDNVRRRVDVIPWHATPDSGADQQVLVDWGSQFTHRDDITGFPPNWFDFDFDDSEWAKAKAPLMQPPRGPRRSKSNLQVGPLAFVFRHRFDLATGPNADQDVLIELKRRDGAIVRINGREVVRSNMSAGVVLTSTPALRHVTAEELRVVHRYRVDSSVLKEGANILAVELHRYQPGRPAGALDIRLTLVPKSLNAANLSREQFDNLLDEVQKLPEFIRTQFEENRFFVVVNPAPRQAAVMWLQRYFVQISMGNLELALNAAEEGLRRATPLSNEHDRLVQLKTQALHRLNRSEEAHKAGLDWVNGQLASAGAVRINAGGKRFTSSDNVVWAEDGFYRGGMIYLWGTQKLTAEVENTDHDPLYQTERWFKNQRNNLVNAYQIPLPNGRYRVNLHMAEVWYRESGKRTFNVLLEGETLVKDYDVSKNGFLVPDIKSSDVLIKDGVLNIDLKPIRENPKISAIEIVPIKETSGD